MTGEYSIKIGEKTKQLKFNNFAHVELSKAIFEAGYLVKTPSDLVDKLAELAKTNVALLIKALLYAGIVGHDYEVGFKASVTQQEVSKLVAEVNETDLLNMWDIFLEAMGVSVSELISRNAEQEEQEDVEEKKSSTT